MEFSYVCSECGGRLPIEPQFMVCPQCSVVQSPDQPLRGVLEVELAGAAPAEWTISSLLPIAQQFFPPIPVGNTPLWAPRRLRRELDFPGLYIKDDGLNPTCSLKDRASFLVSAFAAKFGIDEIVLASTGNAGSSMAGVGAAAGQKVTLFLPKAAPKAKLIQALQYGARVFRVDGSYDDAYDLSLAYTAKFGGLSRNTAYNPMTIEGKKTVSLEVFRQLGRVPTMSSCPSATAVFFRGSTRASRTSAGWVLLTGCPWCTPSRRKDPPRWPGPSSAVPSGARPPALWPTRSASMCPATVFTRSAN